MPTHFLQNRVAPEQDLPLPEIAAPKECPQKIIFFGFVSNELRVALTNLMPSLALLRNPE